MNVLYIGVHFCINQTGISNLFRNMGTHGFFCNSSVYCMWLSKSWQCFSLVWCPIAYSTISMFPDFIMHPAISASCSFLGCANVWYEPHCYFALSSWELHEVRRIDTFSLAFFITSGITLADKGPLESDRANKCGSTLTKPFRIIMGQQQSILAGKTFTAYAVT